MQRDVLARIATVARSPLPSFFRHHLVDTLVLLSALRSHQCDRALHSFSVSLAQPHRARPPAPSLSSAQASPWPSRQVSLVWDRIDHPPTRTAPNRPRYMLSGGCLSVARLSAGYFCSVSPWTELLSNALISVRCADLAKRTGLVPPRYFFHLSFGDRLL